jgi:hypothetical protein
MDQYLSSLTRFTVARINTTDFIWQLSVDGKFAGVLYNEPAKGFWAKTIRTVDGNTFSSIAWGITAQEALRGADSDFANMADWDRDADPVDEEAEIDRERHAD